MNTIADLDWNRARNFKKLLYQIIITRKKWVFVSRDIPVLSTYFIHIAVEIHGPLNLRRAKIARSVDGATRKKGVEKNVSGSEDPPRIGNCGPRFLPYRRSSVEPRAAIAFLLLSFYCAAVKHKIATMSARMIHDRHSPGRRSEKIVSVGRIFLSSGTVSLRGRVLAHCTRL